MVVKILFCWTIFVLSLWSWISLTVTFLFIFIPFYPLEDNLKSLLFKYQNLSMEFYDIIHTKSFENGILTVYQSKTRRPWFQVLFGYSSLHNGTRIKSKMCSEKFSKLSIWLALRFSKLDKGELRIVSLKIFNWALKMIHFTGFLSFWGGETSLNLCFFCILRQKSGVFVIIGKEIF